MAGAPGRTSWVRATPTSASAWAWAMVPAGVTGTHGAAQDEGHHDGRLVGRRVGPHHTGHDVVVDQGRVDVDVAQDDAVLLDEVRAEEDAAELDGVRSPLGRRHRAHEGPVRPAHVGIDHVQVALVHRDVDRLADGAAGVVQPGREIGQLDEVGEVLDRAVAAPALQVAHEGRAVGRRKDGVAAADHHRAFGIAGDLGEAAGRRPAERRDLSRLEADPRPDDVGAGLLEEPQRFLVAAELDADLLQDAVGVGLDLGQPFFAHKFIGGDLPRDVGRPDKRRALPPRPAGGAALRAWGRIRRRFTASAGG